ncbi:Hypothetical predicted protein, partial [Paramuricea clavata]
MSKNDKRKRNFGSFTEQDICSKKDKTISLENAIQITLKYKALNIEEKNVFKENVLS